jgi:hypothetical protein
MFYVNKLNTDTMYLCVRDIHFYKVILIKYNSVETVTNPVERGKMDISNTQIHGVSIQFIYIKHIHFMSI